MGNFLKAILASTLGVFIALFLFSIFSIFILISVAGIFTEDEAPVIVESNSILKLTFDSPVVDNPQQNVMSAIDLLSLENKIPLSLLNVVISIEAAKEDPNIEGIYLDLSFFALDGFATIEEIRTALIDFKTSGKFIISYADNFSQGAYYLASVADEIYMNKMGMFELKGLSSTITFYKGTLDKLDIEPQIIRHGKYKSFVEPFTSTEMSKESHQQTQELIESIWNVLLTNIADERGVDKKQLNEAISNLEVSDPESANKNNLIDGIKHHDEVISILAEKMNQDSLDNLKFIDFKKYSKSVSRVRSDNKIAIIYAEGDIMYGSKKEGKISNIDIISKMKQARDNDNVKAVVLRVNSGGGSALSAELMWREIEKTRKEKPVIVSLGDVAASGGYYIAAASDAIVCSPTTITGSIGVFSILFNIGATMENKLGITTSVVKTNKAADMFNPFRDMTSTEKLLMQKYTTNVYDTFVERVAIGRNLTTEKINDVAQGRVWSGTQAIENGLVDGIGGIKYALLLAATKAGLDSDFEYYTVNSKRTVFEELVNELSSIESMFTSNDILSKEILNIKDAIKIEPLQARMPYEIIVE